MHNNKYICFFYFILNLNFIKNMASSSNSNEILFTRSLDQNEKDDIWDDEALIRAYDKSIRKVKKEIANKLLSKINPENLSNTSKYFK